MLVSLRRLKKTLRTNFALLFFISGIAFQTQASEDIKNETAETYRALGFAEHQKGNLNEALAYYTKATSLGLKSAVVLNDMGVLYENIDLYAKAEQYYLSAIKTDERYLPAYINLAYLYQRFGQNDKAASYFKRRFELGDPNDPWAQKAKEELLKIRPDYADWVNSLDAASLNQDLVERSRDEFYHRVKRSQEHLQKGQDLYAKGKFSEAIQEYDSAMQLAPQNPKIMNERNKALLDIAKESVREQSQLAIRRLEAGDTVAARHEIEKILATIPNKPILISQ